MFYINEISTLWQWCKTRLYDFFAMKLLPFIKYQSPTLFSVTQHHEKRWDPPTFMRDVIIEEPHNCNKNYSLQFGFP